MENGKPKLLFISGSIGMGHVTRDMAILKEIRRLRPDIGIECLAGEPAASVLRSSGWTLAPECSDPVFQKLDVCVEGLADGYQLPLWEAFYEGGKVLDAPFKVYQGVVERGNFDLVVGDEAYEVMNGYMIDPNSKKVPFIWMIDFVKNYPLSWSPKERFIVWMLNRFMWNKPLASAKKGIKYADVMIFIGEPEDFPEERLGLFLGKASELRNFYKIVGYAPDFNPRQYLDQTAMKKELGYGGEKLIICSIGGTAVGKPLLDLCVRAYPFIKEKVPDIKMLIVAGPMVKAEKMNAPEGVEVKGYVPELYKHFAACDLAIVQGGGSTTFELTALKRPFIYFPLEGHFEQQVIVPNGLQRHRAGFKMRFPGTTPQMLAEAAVANLGKKVDYVDVPVDGARKAAEIIVGCMPS
jgi:predicted glycosyltransferase